MSQKSKRVDNKGRKLPDGFSQRKDGRYQARFTHSGKRYTLYDKNLANLKIKVTEMQNSLNKGTYTAGSVNPTLNQWFITWMETYKVNLKRETKANYYKYWHWYIEETIGKLKIKDIKRSDIIKLYNHLILGEKGLSTGTIKYINNLVSSSLAKAIDEDIIYKNPASKILKEVVQTEEKKKEPLNELEQSKLIGFVESNSYYKRFAPLLIVMLLTGCRVGEVSSLTWDCIDFDKGTIIINKTLKYMREITEDGLHYYISTPKTKASNREIPMTSDVKKALYTQKEYQKNLGLMSKVMVCGYKDFVFTTSKRNPMYPDYINLEIKRIIKTHNNEEVKKAELENREPFLLPDISPHVTRHTFASECYNRGIDVKTTQEVMGHDIVVSTLDIYTKCSRDKVKKDISLLDNIFYNKK